MNSPAKLIPFLLLLLAPACIRAQLINTFAGNGISGFSGDGGLAVAAQFQELLGIATDTAGNVYIPDYNNNVIRKVTTDGIINTIAGTGDPGYSGDGGPASAAKLNRPWNVAIDMSGNLYITEQVNNCIRKINTTGIITTVAGTGTAGFSGNGGPATAAALNQPWGIAFDNAGNIYLTDGGNGMVRAINAAGTITTIAGTGTVGYNGDGILAVNAHLSNPAGLAWRGGELYIADNLNNRIRKINAAGIISTVAGTGAIGYSGDGGAAASAMINTPQGMCVDAAGNLYFSDFGNNVVRKISGTNITTIAGTGAHGFSGDDGHPLLAKFSQPWSVAVGKENTVYITDKNNYRVRKIYTRTAGVDDISSNKFSFYPNPAYNELVITAADQINDVRITNLPGQQVYSRQYSSKEIHLDIAALQAGIYLVQVNGVAAGRFIKQ